MQSTMHVYEVHPRRDRRGVDLISDVLPFGRLWFSTTPHNQEPQGGMGPRCGSLSLSLSLSVIERCGMRRTRGDLRLRRAQRKLELAIRERELRVCHP